MSMEQGLGFSFTQSSGPGIFDLPGVFLDSVSGPGNKSNPGTDP